MNKGNQPLVKKAATSIVFLTAKRIFLQIIFTGSNVFLARLLFPADFGTFAIIGSVGIFFNVFSDLGMTQALIQKRLEIKRVDIQTAFTTQLILGLILALLIFLTAGEISKFFNLGSSGVGLLKLYSLMFLIVPFRQIPGAILERYLNFKKIVMLDIVGALVSSGSTIFLAFLGYGVASLVIGLVIGNLIGVILLWIFARWPIGISFDKKVFWNLTRFGIPFQSHVILGLFYGPLILLYLGKAVGQANLGYYQFAANLSVFSLVFSEILARVIFPLGSRTQKDEVFLKQAIEKSIALVSMVTMPAIFLIAAVASQIIHYVYTDRWLPALPALYLGLAQMGIMAYTGIFGQLLLARGRAGVMRNMGFVWGVLTWVLAPILIAKFNFVGMNLTGLLVSVSGIWLFFRLKREISFNFGRGFLKYFALAFGASGLTVATVNVLPESFASLVFALILGVIFYFGLLAVFARQVLRENLQLVFSMIFREKP